MPEIFRPGNKTRLSGVYKVVHGREHSAPHYVTMLFGDVFPSCLKCSDVVRFELAVSATHVNAHPHFMIAR